MIKLKTPSGRDTGAFTSASPDMSQLLSHQSPENMTELCVHQFMNGLHHHDEILEGSVKSDSRRIQDYFYTALLVACICFYMPTGLLAVQYAKKARKALRSGKEEDAERFSQKSLVLILTTLITLPVLFITALVT